ncbi:hypothetical protein PFNF54_00348, partial [Plasmodium falciparum NF54]
MVRTLDPEEELRGIEDTTAKHIFDRIGKIVHEKAKKNAEQYRSQLKGSLLKATFEKAPAGQQTPGNTCELKYQWHTNVTKGGNKEYPCRNGTEKRFSEVSGGECDDSKIKGSNGGACAPFRRLNLCVRNLENINNYGKINNDTLLADVCLAALHEGDSIRGDHDKYKETNDSSQLCTMLARSFADIGDIIRGKDLYRGNNGKDKLEENLKTIFGKIHEGLKNGKTNGIEERYGNDPDFFQLREDWWTANRETVWKAIRCSAPRDADYFIKTVCSGGKTPTQGKCRCIDFSVPTYFDYVPQYLRWFEEWAEDFCRLRKHKLQNAKNKCREKHKDGKKLYCDLNGFDCTQTARGKNKYKYEHDCIECYSSCDHFVHWIDNQKKEFEKQKNKYDKEIKKAYGKNGTTTKETSNGPINNLYVGDFYSKLQQTYGSVDKFLKKLNDEAICKKHPEVEEKTDVNFNENLDDIFSHTKYCQACPLCGLENDSPPWKPKPEKECRDQQIRNFDDNESNEIKLLVKDKGGQTMVEKLGGLCGNGAKKNNIQEKTWKCYYDKNKENSIGGGDKDYCVLKNDKKNRTQLEIVSFNSLFWRWVTEMLKDSIDWRKEYKNCINNGDKSTCKNVCKKPCDCFQKWGVRKTKEWQQVKAHYEKEDFGKGLTPYKTLEWVLDLSYFPIIKEAHPKEKPVQKMEEIIKKNQENISRVTKQNNSITKFLQQELQEANNCLQKRKQDCKPPQQSAEEGVAKTGQPRAEDEEDSPRPDAGAGEVDDEDDDADNDDEITPRDLNIEVDDLDSKDPEDQVEEEKAKDNTDETVETAKETKEDTDRKGEEKQPKEEVDNVKPCEIVKTLFTNGDNTALNEACKQKYQYGKEKFPNWKCVPTTRGSGEPTGSSGSICVPPRRRRLYVTPLTRLAGGGNTAASQGSGEAAQPVTVTQPQASGGNTQVAVSPGGAASSTSTTESSQLLRQAFIESAAVETFFLWHKYKVDKEKEDKEKNGRNMVVYTSPVPNDLYEKLKKGEIPDDFLRQMFYTLADYKDILFSGDKDNKNGYNDILSGDKELHEREKEIKGAIEKHFSNSVKTPSTSGNDAKTWWKENAPHIWEGMICALTYKETSGSGGEKQIEKDSDVYNKFFGSTAATQKGTYESKYKYTDVKLEENSGTGGPRGPNESPNSKPPSSTSENKPTTLDSFIKRPPYFRYLEEWGETFCRERAKRLAQIKVDCRGDENTNRSNDGDGFDCEKKVTNKDVFLEDFNGSSCATCCSSYRKWIERKKIEFEEQENAYEEQQKKNCVNGNNKGGVNGVCGKLEENAAGFLQKLGSCKKDSGEDNGNGNEEDKLNFRQPNVTFRPAENCKPCSLIEIKCKNGVCNGDPTKGECNGETVTAEEIEKMNDLNGNIDMLVSDNGKNEIPEDLKSSCKDANIFKGIREDVWKCGKFRDVDVCVLKNFNKHIHDKKNVLIRTLFKRWLEYFFEDYNRIQKKLKPCIENGKGKEQKCFKGCKENCDCVKKWVEEKEKEWPKIRKRYLEQYKNAGGSDDYKVKSFLEDPQFYNEVNKAVKPCDDLNAFERSIHCNGPNSSQKKDVERRDVVVCLLDKLEKEAKKCEQKHQNSGNPQQPCEGSTPPDDEEEELLEEDEQNTVGKEKVGNKAPAICGDVEEQKEKEEGDCDKAVTPDSDTGGNGEKEDSRSEEEEEVSGSGDQGSPPAPPPPESPQEKAPAPAPEELPPGPERPPKPAAPTSTPEVPAQPLPSDNTSDILKTTIPFGIALALTSIALLFLK